MCKCAPFCLFGGVHTIEEEGGRGYFRVCVSQEDLTVVQVKGRGERALLCSSILANEER